jgi:Asp-tRNA(Asn)/Glu-tRNA(Gln) amidotransferase A subunit family amidase
VTERGRDKVEDNYKQYLDREGLQGARIGVLRQFFEIEDTGQEEQQEPKSKDTQESTDNEPDGDTDNNSKHKDSENSGKDQADKLKVGVEEESKKQQQDEADRPRKVHPEILRIMNQALEAMEEAGAIVVDPVDIPDLKKIRKDFPRIRRLKHDFNKYLASRPEVPVKTLDEILESRDYHPFLRYSLNQTKEVDYVPEEHPDYQKYLEAEEQLRAAVLKVMDDNDLDVLAYPTFNYPPRRIGDLNTPYGANSGTLSPPTGFPAFNVPMGYSFGKLPAGLQLLGRPFSEPTLIRLCYAYEQATRHRRPPESTPPLP